MLPLGLFGGNVLMREGVNSRQGRDPLAKAEQRGSVLGNPNVGKMVTEAAAARDAKLKPILKAMSDMPYRDIAQELTNRKHSNVPRWRRVECNDGHAHTEAIGHRGQEGRAG